MTGVWFRALSTVVGVLTRAGDAVADRLWAIGGDRHGCDHRRCPKVWVGECPNIRDQDCLVRIRMDRSFRDWMVARGMDD